MIKANNKKCKKTNLNAKLLIIHHIPQRFVPLQNFFKTIISTEFIAIFSWVRFEEAK